MFRSKYFPIRSQQMDATHSAAESMGLDGDNRCPPSLCQERGVGVLRLRHGSQRIRISPH